MNRLGDVITAGIADRLEALLVLAQRARAEPVEEVLVAVAETARDVLGFRGVVINLYRPAWHDYEAVIVLGGDDPREALLGTTNAYDQLHDLLLLERFERVPGAYFLAAGTDVWEQIDNTYHDPATGQSGPDGWQSRDGLLVPLRTAVGAPLGVVSVDDPVSGLRPSDGDLRMLVTVCSYAALALETAQARRAAEVHERTLAGILDFATMLPRGASPAEVLDQVCATAGDVMGFETVAGFARDEVGELVWMAGIGRGLHASAEALETIEFDAEGIALVPAAHPSPREGSGPLAWGQDTLWVELRDAAGEPLGGLVFSDPRDCLRPDRTLRQELRLLADQAATALAVANRERRLQTLVVEDPLTGLRNRRDLEKTMTRLIDSGDPFAVLIFDLDHFKEINDRCGHDVGDLVLGRFGGLLAAHARDSDLAIRMGGEEFCLLLPRTEAGGAAVVAERIRTEAPALGADLPIEPTVSVGFAVGGPGEASVRNILSAADRALYAAKREGRDCVRDAHREADLPAAP